MLLQYRSFHTPVRPLGRDPRRLQENQPLGPARSPPRREASRFRLFTICRHCRDARSRHPACSLGDELLSWLEYADLSPLSSSGGAIASVTPMLVHGGDFAGTVRKQALTCMGGEALARGFARSPVVGTIRRRWQGHCLGRTRARQCSLAAVPEPDSRNEATRVTRRMLCCTSQTGAVFP
jgi:hypothetical protein